MKSLELTRKQNFPPVLLVNSRRDDLRGYESILVGYKCVIVFTSRMGNEGDLTTFQYWTIFVLNWSKNLCPL